MSAGLKAWKGKMITRPGRLLLVNSVITAMARQLSQGQAVITVLKIVRKSIHLWELIQNVQPDSTTEI